MYNKESDFGVADKCLTTSDPVLSLRIIFALTY